MEGGFIFELMRKKMYVLNSDLMSDDVHLQFFTVHQFEFNVLCFVLFFELLSTFFGGI